MNKELSESPSPATKEYEKESSSSASMVMRVPTTDPAGIFSSKDIAVKSTLVGALFLCFSLT